LGGIVQEKGIKVNVIGLCGEEGISSSVSDVMQTAYSAVS